MSFYSRGDIVLIPFPFTDLKSSKLRPAIVVSSANVNKTEDLILAQITSDIKNDNFSFEIKDADVTRPLNGYSEIRCHKIFTGSKSIITKKISSLKPHKQIDLFSQIVTLLD